MGSSDFLYVSVDGVEPAPQGSKNPWGGEANPRTKPWREMLGATAAEKMDETGFEKIPSGVPLRIVAIFLFSRPKSHYRASGKLKESAPLHVTKKPDLDKLLRAVGDALTGVAFHDDSQVVEWVTRKLYSERPGCTIQIMRADGGEL